MKKFELVIVGGGVTAAHAIKAHREAGGDGRIALVGSETELPYHRPPLSKRYLRGEADADDTRVETERFYREQDIELVLGAEVVELVVGDKTVVTRDAQRLGYEKLLLASGSSPRTLDVAGADLPGVFTLRSLGDAAAIRHAAAETRDAVVVGSGFIGMEVAASLTILGLDVTLVSRDTNLFGQLRSPEISEHLLEVYRHHGVDIIRGDEVQAFRGHSRLDSVELHIGDPLGAHLAVVGVGVQPNTSFLAGSGVALDDGVVVNERFETNIPDVYAAGDVARFFDPVFGRARRIEHWSNAAYQGTEVGKVLAGVDGGYDTVSTFFTESFGLTLKIFGDVSQHDDRIARGSVADGKAIVFYLEGARLVGTLHAGQDKATEHALENLIRSRATPDLGLLVDETIPLERAFADADLICA